MKYLILFTLMILMTGCAEPDENWNNSYETVQSEPETTIKEVEKGTPFGTHVEIFMAKGHEYVSTYKGGLVHSESCPNSKHDRNYDNQ